MFAVGVRSGSSGVGHVHLNSNSFVQETRGAPVLVDEGRCRDAHVLGLFTRVEGYGGQRWNFDALAAIGLNAILLDGGGLADGNSLTAETAKEAKCNV